jgi:hypothetical protein
VVYVCLSLSLVVFSIIGSVLMFDVYMLCNGLRYCRSSERLTPTDATEMVERMAGSCHACMYIAIL